MRTGILGAVLATAIAGTAAAQDNQMPPPSMEGTTVDGSIYSFCFETADSTEASPVYMTGGAYFPMTLPENTLNSILRGLRGSFETAGYHHTSVDILTRNSEVGRVFQNQLETIAYYYGPVKAGLIQKTVDYCPETAEDALENGEWFAPNMAEPEGV